MDLEKIKQIATAARKELVTEDDDAEGRCLELSRDLQKKLMEAGFNAFVIQGTFFIDCPDPSKYDDWEAKDFGGAAAMERAKHKALHYWVEIQEKRQRLVVDISADQFNEELDESVDPMEEVIIGEYAEMDRYKRKGIWKGAESK